MNSKPTTARDVIGDYLAEQCTVIIDSEAELRAGENVIHKARVAVRRLRSTIRVFADLFDPEQAARLEEELVWPGAGHGHLDTATKGSACRAAG
jgi:inorganic triphosphatase YgiF